MLLLSLPCKWVTQRLPNGEKRISHSVEKDIGEQRKLLTRILL
jgi:hypothetical protein